MAVGLIFEIAGDPVIKRRRFILWCSGLAAAPKLIMEPFEWDKQEMFTGSNGVTAVRYAISDHEGVTVEASMHDPTIRSMLPVEFWLPVHNAQIINARINRVDEWLVSLIGFGKSSDPLGNLTLTRVRTEAVFSAERLSRVITMIFKEIAGHGIRLDQSIIKKIRGN